MLKDRMSVPPEEQETSIIICPIDKDTASVYTSTPAMIRKIYKWADEYPDQVKIISDDGYGVIVEVPVSWASLKPYKKRVMTEEQKQAAAARLAALRERKKS